MRSPVILRIFKDNKLLEVKQFDLDQIIFGQDAEVQIDLRDPEVSPIHCLIEIRDSGYYICDLGSRTGTYKNSQKVLDEPISSGDQIKIGPFFIHFFVGIPKPRVAPPSVKEPEPIAPIPPIPTMTSEPNLPPMPPLPIASPLPNLPEVSLSSGEAPPSPTPQNIIEKEIEKEEVTLTATIIPVFPETSKDESSSPPPVPNIEKDKAVVPPNSPYKEVISVKPLPPGPAPTSARPGAPVPSSQVPQGVQPIPQAPKLKEFNNKESGSNFQNSRYSKKSKYFNTFAKASQIKDLRSFLKPQRGPLLEIIVAWGDRILSSHHFSAQPRIIIGPTAGAHIFIPQQFVAHNIPVVEVAGGCRVLATPQMKFEVITSSTIIAKDELIRTGRANRINGGGNFIKLEQGEMVCLSVDGDILQLFIRYIPAVPKPLLAGPLDFTSGELTSLVVSILLVALFSVYMALYTPRKGPETKTDEQKYVAVVLFNQLNKPSPTPFPPMPTPMVTPLVVQTPPPPLPTVPPTPPPPPKNVKTEATPDFLRPSPKPMPTVKKVELADKRNTQNNKGKDQKAAAQLQSKSTELKPTNHQTEKKIITSIKQGGSISLGGDKDGASANAPPKKDITKTGLLSAFGGGGVKDNIDKAYKGSGDLLGMAENATGASGMKDNRSGDDIGSKIKDAGVAGGKGVATQGIAGLKIKGRSTGLSNYGELGNSGTKTSVLIEAGGVGENWNGSIDREAVRRVIRSIINQIKSCYERKLKTNTSLEGKLVIKFTIEEQGRVRRASTKSSSLNDSDVDSCVISRIKEAKFPEPPSGSEADVEFPFLFGAQK